MTRAKPAKLCAVCISRCESDHLALTPTLVTETLRLSYKPVIICSESCLREWASNTVWHDDLEPSEAIATTTTLDGGMTSE